MTIDTASDQIAAAGAALALLSVHRDLPGPSVEFTQIMTLTGSDLGWGVRLSLHKHLDDFEQWRRALDIDPATVTEHTSGDVGLWRAIGRFAGVPVALVGFYDRLPGDE